MINPGSKLDKNTILKIEESFDRIYDEVGFDELHFVNNEFPKLYEALCENGNWTQDIVDIVKIMLDTSEWKGNFTEINKIVLSCAFYLCKPDDVIPDTTPGIGLVDDAYVVNLSLKKIKKTQKGSLFCDTIEQQFKLLRSQ